MSKVVALMCGHGKSVNGSWDTGTTYAGYTEAGLMLPITKSAVKYLRSYGVKVISDADTNNNKNMIVDVQWANRQKADIYVSVHCDWCKAPSGVMPLYVSTEGRKLATALNKAVKSGMGMKSRGVVRRTDLHELNATSMPACILETGSIKADLTLLRKHPNKYGKAIAKGICNYLGIKIPAKKTAKPKAEPKAEKVTAPAKVEPVKATPTKAQTTEKPWQDKAWDWAKKISKDDSYHYVVWSKDKRSHECPICHKHPKGKYHGGNCIWAAYAAWHHGAGLKSRCSCGVVANEVYERILRAKTKEEAEKIASEHIGIPVTVIRNHGKAISKAKFRKGDICAMFSGSKYLHTWLNGPSGWIFDASRGYSNTIGIRKKFDSYAKSTKLIIRPKAR